MCLLPLLHLESCGPKHRLNKPKSVFFSDRLRKEQRALDCNRRWKPPLLFRTEPLFSQSSSFHLFVTLLSAVQLSELGWLHTVLIIWKGQTESRKRVPATLPDSSASSAWWERESISLNWFSWSHVSIVWAPVSPNYSFLLKDLKPLFTF